MRVCDGQRACTHDFVEHVEDEVVVGFGFVFTQGDSRLVPRISRLIFCYFAAPGAYSEVGLVSAHGMTPVLVVKDYVSPVRVA